jgi:broad specificity phosphatase PhoE
VGGQEAAALGARLDGQRIDLGVASELRRTQETLELALDGRTVPILVLPEWNEIDFGSYEGGPLAAYREWAWSTPADVDCPGGGESRTAIATRVVEALRWLLDRPEDTILAVGHALPIRYVLDGSAGRPPPARIGTIGHAQPHWISREEAETAAATLRAWVHDPRFADAGAY